ncbi:MAG: hypothetical protein WAW39_11030 [Prosthecobacter sp.]|uniref:hypothetical protein n=1 Tax=Prosthecobacter sp. TaxID=1965333 RepID=UPI003BAF2D20
MSSSTDLPACEGCCLGGVVPGALGAAGVRMGTWMRLLGAGMLLVGMLSACSAPPKEGGVVEDAKETPKDRYGRRVNEVILKKWKIYSEQRPNETAYGSLKVDYYVSPKGQVERIHVRNNQDTDPILTRFTVKAIQDAKFPPIPADVIPLLKPEQEGCMGFVLSIHLPERTKGGSAAASSETLANAERAPEQREIRQKAKMLMEKRWGMPPEIREGNVRKVAQPGETKQPSSPPTKGGSASGGTQTTVKLTSTPKERYTQRVTQAVEKKWRIYLKLQMEGVTYGSLKVNFYVNKQGKVEDPLVVDDKDSYRALTLLTLRAIKDAEIPPMPIDVFPLLPMNDPERLKIEYNVLIY